MVEVIQEDEDEETSHETEVKAVETAVVVETVVDITEIVLQTAKVVQVQVIHQELQEGEEEINLFFFQHDVY